MPAASSALMCRNTSGPPSSGPMKPYPRSALKNFTEPVVIAQSTLFSRCPLKLDAALFLNARLFNRDHLPFEVRKLGGVRAVASYKEGSRPKNDNGDCCRNLVIRAFLVLVRKVESFSHLAPLQPV